MGLDELIGELMAERYRPTERGPLRVHSREAGGPDNDISCARRRRVLCEALDDAPDLGMGAVS